MMRIGAAVIANKSPIPWLTLLAISSATVWRGRSCNTSLISMAIVHESSVREDWENYEECRENQEAALFPLENLCGKRSLDRVLAGGHIDFAACRIPGDGSYSDFTIQSTAIKPILNVGTTLSRHNTDGFDFHVLVGFSRVRARLQRRVFLSALFADQAEHYANAIVRGHRGIKAGAKSSGIEIVVCRVYVVDHGGRHFPVYVSERLRYRIGERRFGGDVLIAGGGGLHVQLSAATGPAASDNQRREDDYEQES